MKGGIFKMDGYCKSGYCFSSSGSSFPRGFLTKKEKIEMLKEYKDSLDKESKGITERIAELEDED